MKAHRKLVQVASGVSAVLALSWYAVRSAEATPPSGVAFVVLSRAVVPEFAVKRKYRQIGDEANPVGKIWKIELATTRMIEVVTVKFTVQPGGDGGWHTHPGPAVFTVSAGTLTMYEGDDPACTPRLFPAGTGSIEADTIDHNHLLRNETDTVAETIVTFLLPVGSALRTDLPDPGNCTF
jgi:hypothetical protein